MKNRKLIKKMAYVGILAALSCVFYIFLKFPLPFIFPSFLDIQFSNLPVILAGFIFGPIESILIVVVRFFIKLPMSTTASIGEFADLIIGFLVAVTTSVTYKKVHTKKGGYLALLFGILVWIIGGVLTNLFISLPWYVNQYGLEAVLGILNIIPGINESNYMLYYCLFSVIPFNLLLSTIVSIVTMIIYKRLSFMFKEEVHENKNNYSLIVGLSICIMDIIILVGNLVFKKSTFIVSSTNSLFSVILTIIIYLIVFIFGLFLIIKNIIMNKKIREKH